MSKQILLRFGDIKSFDDAVKELKSNKTIFGEEAKRRIEKLAKLLESQVSVPMLRELRRYPPTRDRTNKVRWKSEKQRRYVMMMASKGEIRLPYIRTGRLADNWKCNVTITYSRTEAIGILKFEVFNAWPDSQFVIGKIGQGESTSSLREYVKPIQPFHSDTGWLPAHAIVKKYFTKAKNLVKAELTDWSMKQS